MGLDREASLEKVERENVNQGRVRYTITYDPQLPKIPAILHKNWKVMVNSDQRLKKAFEKPPMACLKRGPNLSDSLVRARLPPKIGRGGNRAGDGEHLFVTGLASDKKSKVTQVTIYHNGMTINIKQPITCRDSYCLYVLSCKKPGCMKQYGGLTSRPVYIRFAEHLHDIRYGIVTSPVGLHWQEPGHTLDHLEFIAAAMNSKLTATDKCDKQTWAILVAMSTSHMQIFNRTLWTWESFFIAYCYLKNFKTVLLFQNFLMMALKMLKIIKKIWKSYVVFLKFEGLW